MSWLAKLFALLLSFAGLLLGATNAMAATYTWVGAAGASWATSTNWSPARTTPGVTDVLQFSSGGTATPTAVPTQTIGQLLISGNTAVTLTGTNGNPILSVGQAIAGTDLNVTSGSSLTLANGGTSFTLRYTTTQTGTTGSIAGTLTVNAATTWSVSTGTTSTTSVTGTVINAGTITGSAATLTFASTGIYRHNFTTTNGVIPTATWSAGSTCRIVGYTTATGGAAGLGYNQTFSNFEWDTPNQTATFSTNGALTTVNGNFTVTNTNTGAFSLGAAVAGNLAIGGNFSQTGGTFLGSSGNARTITTTGSFSLSGGTFNLSSSATVANAVTVTVGTDFTHSAGTLTESGATTGSGIIFPSGSHNYTSGGTVSNIVNFTVNSGSTLQMAAATTVVTGGGGFTLSSGGTMGITSTAGITATGGGAVGNIQVTGTRSYNTGANYTYNNATPAAQVTGSGLPATVNNFTINNASGVALSGSVTVSGTLALTSGVLTTTTFTVITSASCLVPSVVRTGGHVAGFLQKNIPVGAPVSCTFEVGDAATYRPIGTTFVSVTTAGNLVGSVSQAAGEHPQCCGATPFGLDSAKDVHRYWTITNPGGIIFTTYSATFNFINPTDFDAGATPANFEVENWSGAAWLTTTAGTRTLTSTQASGIAAFGDFAVGEKKPITPGSFNAFETSTAAGAITGKIFTKLAGGAPSLDIVAISGGVQMNTFTNTVTVELLGNQTVGVPLDAQNCPTSFTLIQTVAPNPTITSGRSTVNFAAVTNAWKDVRVRVRYPVASPTVTSCSTDNFSIRPTGFTVSSTNAGNNGTSGAPAIKTGAGFNLTATSVVGYNGTPAIDNTIGMVTGTPNAGVIGGVFTAAPAATGTAAGNAFFYSEVGNFGLNTYAVFDNTFTSVDQPNDCTADFSNVLVGGKIGCKFGSTAIPLVIGSSGFGRFIPDNFNVGYNTPAFGAACGTFGYTGQIFSFTAAPVMTVVARQGTANGLTNATTANYAGAYMKLSNASLSQAPYDTTAGRYSRFDALGGGATPALDTSGLPLAASDPAIGTFTNGVGTLTFGAGTGLRFTRSITAPSAPFNAEIALAISVVDADGVAFAGNPAAFGSATAGGGIAFGGGKEMRFGRLRLSNAHGSELLNLPVPIQAQYWNGTSFVTNTSDNCTTLVASNIKLTTPPAGVSATVGGAFSSGVGSLTLTKPTTPAKVAVDLCVDLGADPVGGTVCSAATSANLPYLQGLWPPGTSYNNDPGARATFGVYKGMNEFIYLRENY